LKVISWNLNHRTIEKPIPADIVTLFSGLHANLILRNVFVDGRSRSGFRDSPTDAGYIFQMVSPTPAGHNQVFAASSSPFRLGDSRPPSFDGSATSNCLHIQFTTLPLELVGLRVPGYTLAADRRTYWAQLVAIMRGLKDRSIAFIGDINRDPFSKSGSHEVRSIPFADRDGYVIQNPIGGWSFINYNGAKHSRFDHVIHASALDVASVNYVAEVGGRVLAGPKSTTPISDHAALVLEIQLSDAVPDLTESGGTTGR